MLDKDKNKGFLDAIRKDKYNTDLHAVYADFLEESGELERMARHRQKAGQGFLIYKIRRKSDGLFLNSHDDEENWNKIGRSFKTKSGAAAEINSYVFRRQVDKNDIEIVVMYGHFQEVAACEHNWKK